MGQRLYVGNLSFDTTAESLRSEFAKIDEVTDVQVVADRDTGRSRGFGFVTMGSAPGALRAIAEMNGAVVEGRPLRVNEAEERQQHGGGGGGDGGGRRGGHRGW
jgi:RNA recognition motif-containing protein